MAKSLHPRVPADLVVATVVSLVVLGPLVLLPGYSLRGDMVFVPGMPWKDGWLGLDGSAPRAVPMDALVSVATYVVPGWLVQKAALLGALVAGGVGAGRLVGEEPAYARAAAILLFLWNPWVAERLSIGQWAIVAGYCTLPLLALAGRRVRDDVRRGWPYLVIGMVVCAVCSPSSGLMGGFVVLAVVLGRPRMASLGVATATVVVANLPWLVPSLLLQSGGLGQGPEFSSFAAHGESAAGLLASVLSLGGIWKSAVVPGERTSAVIVLASVAVTLIAMVGLRAGRGDRRLRATLVAVGVISFAVAYVPGLAGPASWLDDRAIGARASPAPRLAPVLGTGRADAATGLCRCRPLARREPTTGAGGHGCARGRGGAATSPAAAEPGLGTRRQAGSLVVPRRVGHGGRDPRVRGRRPDHRAAVVRELPRLRVEPGPGGSGPRTSLPARPGVDRRLTGPRRLGSPAGE